MDGSPKGEASPRKRPTFWGWVLIAFCALVVLSAIGRAIDPSKSVVDARTDEPVASPRTNAATASDADSAEAQAMKDAAAPAASVAGVSGLHCLSQWDGSHRGLVEQVKRNLRDPDSFKHVDTAISPATKEGLHRIVMEYRARNGFGGMNVGRVEGAVFSHNCEAVLLRSLDQ